MLERLRVDRPWRGRCIGLAALAETIHILGRGCALAALHPAPLDARHLTAEERALASSDLAAYYARLGFRQVRDTTIWVVDPEGEDFAQAHERLRGAMPF